ncbi:MAG: FtsQ-type POTRA domain-containing protein [Oscillibacter sp.]|nr:FtsQ-type POTRA domain-containing protein [Oscillibacter sp.]
MPRCRRYTRRYKRGGLSFLYKLLSVLLICACFVAAITLFFRVETVEVFGLERYTKEEILEASGIEQGDNLFLMNKYEVIRRIVDRYPYIELENTRIQRKLPDTLLIYVKECGRPLALRQDGSVWLVSPSGKIVEQRKTVGGYGVIDGVQALSPSVGTQLALDSTHDMQLESLLSLLKALEESGFLDTVEAVHLGNLSMVSFECMGRFTVELPYGADYAYKLKTLRAILDSGKIQENMKGTFNMRGSDGKTNFIQSPS